MNIIINASNLRKGGGLQVSDSICRELYKFSNIHFIVVLPLQLKDCKNSISNYPNISVYEYNMPLTFGHIATGRDRFLDTLVKKYDVEAVLTIFGPSRWRPKCLHLCGFAMPHIVLNDSPYWNLISATEKWKQRLRNKLMVRDFRRNTDAIWTENEYISKKVRQKLPKKKVLTVTNNYNQIFDSVSEWDNSINLPSFSGITLLTVTANYPHKNLRIAIDAVEILAKSNPDLKVRFVYTITKEQFGEVPEELERSFIFLGRVKLSQCPHLYLQSDIMFQPSLLECFSATYAEAMKMGIPILTTDLGFAHSLCGSAAYYYSPVDAKSLAEAIIEMAANGGLRQTLVENGRQQLRCFDNYESRAEKLISSLKNLM